jgi:hypothetical protein
MLDNALINLVATQLEAASAAAGWNYIVLQKAPPSRQGIPSAPTIFFEKLFHRNYGWATVTKEFQPTPNYFSHTETQNIETTFQISALVPQDPTDLTIPTASDVVQYMKMFLQSAQTVSLWSNQNVNMLRVTDIRNPYFEDDKHRFEANPNFDFVVTHSQAIVLQVPVVSAINGTPSVIPGDLSQGVFEVPD